MPVWRLQTEIQADTQFAKDALCITPHFDDAGIGSDPQNLCDDLAAGIHTWLGGKVRQIKVTAYDAQGAKPVYPQGEALINIGAAPPFVGPREVALCLSFYSERNIPRHRGRLYIPWGAQNVGGADLSVRPSSSVRDSVAALVPLFVGLGGVDVSWCVYSRMDDEAYHVTNWWIDDEWDTVRSRGLTPTTRTTGEA